MTQQYVSLILSIKQTIVKLNPAGWLCLTCVMFYNCQFFLKLNRSLTSQLLMAVEQKGFNLNSQNNSSQTYHLLQR
jgi:hypothetical protein